MTSLRRSTRVALRPAAATITPGLAVPYVYLYGERSILPDIPVEI